MQAGDAACPTVGYSVKHLLYSSFDDTRDCTACTCGGATGSTCSTTLEMFPSATGVCSGTPSTWTAPITCSSGVAAQVGDVIIKVNTPSGATTFCCLP